MKHFGGLYPEKFVCLLCEHGRVICSRCSEKRSDDLLEGEDG
jgi:hypothetical protein